MVPTCPSNLSILLMCFFFVQLKWISLSSPRLSFYLLPHWVLCLEHKLFSISPLYLNSLDDCLILQESIGASLLPQSSSSFHLLLPTCISIMWSYNNLCFLFPLLCHSNHISLYLIIYWSFFQVSKFHDGRHQNYTLTIDSFYPCVMSYCRQLIDIC